MHRTGLSRTIAWAILSLILCEGMWPDERPAASGAEMYPYAESLGGSPDRMAAYTKESSTLRTEIIINVATHETRIAILEDGQLVEILVERPDMYRTVGHIYKGIVTSVLPGMQAAFVDIGLEKSAFLHVSDVVEAGEEYDAMFDGETDDNGEQQSRTKRQRFVPIQDMLRKGQDILVQVTKDPIGTKGPRVTSEISLAGRFSVLVPGTDTIGVSRKITDWGERRRLRDLVRSLKPDGCGIIIRTVAKGKGEAEFRKELRALKKLWDKIANRGRSTKAPALIHEEMGMTSSLIRDLFTPEVDRLVTDSKRTHRDILSYLRSVSTDLCSRLELYTEKVPIFDAFEIEKEIEKALDRKAWLKKGGFIVIDHTEALVTVDVNTGRYVGKRNQEETVLNINLEAAREIARQLRLRDIGGIIVIDFIDMKSAKNRSKLLEEFQNAIRRDRSKTTVAPVSEFGLVEMTRQRVRPSLMYTFSEPCPLCKGAGRVQGRDTTVTKIERWLKRMRAAASKERKLTLYVHPVVAEYLQADKATRLNVLQKSVRTRLELHSDPDLPMEEYRFFSLKRNLDITQEFKT